MRSLKDIFTMMFKPKKNNEPWLDYYSREERSIKFTDKSIYHYMVDSVGTDKDFFALNYFDNKITYNEFFDKINITDFN